MVRVVKSAVSVGPTVVNGKVNISKAVNRDQKFIVRSQKPSHVDVNLPLFITLKESFCFNILYMFTVVTVATFSEGWENLGVDKGEESHALRVLTLSQRLIDIFCSVYF